MTTIDWHSLAVKTGIGLERGGTLAAQTALAALLGDQALRDAVDWYASGRQGDALASSVLRHLRSPVAMHRCKELVDSSADENIRERAVELLRMLGDHRALEWIPEFMQDKNPGVRFWGFLIIDQLLFDQLVSRSEAESILQLAEAAWDDKLREQAARLRELYSTGTEDEA